MAEIISQSGQSIFDIAISIGYPIDDILELVQQNKQLGSIDYPIETSNNISLTYDPANIPMIAPDTISIVPAIPKTTNTVIAQYGQSIYDLCLSAGYEIEQIYDFMNQNSVSSIDSEGFAGISFTYDLNKVSDNILYTYLQNSRLVLGTQSDESLLPGPSYILVEYWKDIEENYWKVILDNNNIPEIIQVAPTIDFIINQIWMDSNGHLWTIIMNGTGEFVPTETGSGSPIISQQWNNSGLILTQTIDLNGIFQFN